jgi:hypothetical protein
LEKNGLLRLFARPIGVLVVRFARKKRPIGAENAHTLTKIAGDQEAYLAERVVLKSNGL